MATVHNLLFKFAVDSEGILGSDYAAAKVAGNELKGLISYFNSGVRELRVPLMALVDYMGTLGCRSKTTTTFSLMPVGSRVGFRLVAMSVCIGCCHTAAFGDDRQTDISGHH